MKVFIRDLGKMWRTEPVSDSIIALHPLNDVFVHDLPNEDCLCGPIVEDYEVCWLLTHHSLDGREKSEGPIDEAIARGEKIVVLNREDLPLYGVLAALVGAWIARFLWKNWMVWPR